MFILQILKKLSLRNTVLNMEQVLLQNVNVVNILGRSVLKLLFHVNDEGFKDDQFVFNGLEKVALVLLTQSMGNLATVLQQGLTALDHLVDHLSIRVHVRGCRLGYKLIKRVNKNDNKII